MKNSIVKLIAAAIGIMLSLTACTGTENPSEAYTPVSIEIWHYYNGPQKLAFDELVTEFNETAGQEQGIIVEAFGQGNIYDLFQKVHDSVNKKVGAGELPTIFSAYTDTVYDLNQKEMISALDNYFTEEELSEYVDAYINEGRFDENAHLKIMPIAKSTEVLMLNRTDWRRFVADTGTSIDKLHTLEGLVEASQAYYQWTDDQTPDIPNDGKAMFGRDAMANYMILGYYQLTGETLFSHQDDKITFDPDIAALRKLWDNYYLPYINGWFGSFGKFRSDDAKTGDIIAFVGSSSGAYYFPEEVTLQDDSSYPIEAVVFPAPGFQGTSPIAIQQGAGMAVISSDPEIEQAAVTFLRWFTEAERNIDFSISSAYLPVRKEANDISLIQKSEGFQALPSAVQDTLAVSVDMVNEYELYFEKPFQYSSDARKVIEYSLSDHAKADRAQILLLAEAGMSMQDAVALYTTEQNFQDWYQEFVNAVRTAIGEN